MNEPWLLGNAAHTIHPNGAQGFNLVLRDVAELAGFIGTTLRNGGDIGAPQVLDAYSLSRQADQRQVIRFSDLLQRTFNDSGLVKSMLRNSAMLALDASPALKKEFIRRATGLRTKQNRETTAPGAIVGRVSDGRGERGKAGIASAPSHVPPTETLDTEVLVVGGGVIGCSMALLAASGGMECILVEREHVICNRDTGNGCADPGRVPGIPEDTVCDQGMAATSGGGNRPVQTHVRMG